jgi:hypothetical protein
VAWVWVLPAFAVVAAVVVSAIVLAHVAREARAMHASLDRWGRLAVAVDDLQHDARQAERNLRRLTHR